ncbi:MAG: Rieske 2Fe-2S domain-containing protein [Hyphomicrobiaceae bacterium]|nr:Rieske 2Fe-2S domain-containing protein [Anaerolineae bacterium]MCA9908730.1 Rieske 2Fe-2S domain-containing protein [Anaerolineae bacterium]MCB1503585.1 Rieske 2Fe-2S domain-containing protein [Hyphomicrobiaceae bacterium]
MSETSHKHPDGNPTPEQPKWRQDFPIETGQDEYVSRRDFAKFLVLTSGAMAAGQVCIIGQSMARRDEGPPEELAIARDDEIGVGQVVRFDYPHPDEPCLLARLDDGKLLAFGQKCTHLDCAVTPDLPNRKFVCPCHHGYFDALTGQPLAGPPRRPLPRIMLEVRDGVIYATGVELQT